MTGVENLRLFFGALIMSSADNRLVGSATIESNIYPEPHDPAAVKRTARRITERAQLDGDLPTGQYYVILSWQRFGPRPGGEAR